MNISDLKIGSTFELDGKVYLMVEYMHVSRPRLSALVKTKFKNIETGQVLERNFSPNDSVGEAFIERKDLQFSYEDGGLYYFMDIETYDQIPLNKDFVADVMKYVKDETIVTLNSVNGKNISITPPLFVELLITQCEPAVAGDTSKTAYKPATLETGHVVRVPLFVNEGDKIKIDTRTGEYVERVK